VYKISYAAIFNALGVKVSQIYNKKADCGIWHTIMPYSVWLSCKLKTSLLKWLQLLICMHTYVASSPKVYKLDIIHVSPCV